MATIQLRCSNCGHSVAVVDLPDVALPAPRDASAAPDTPLLLRVAEAARLLGVSRTTMYQLVASGRVRSVTIGRSRRIPRESLERLVESVL